MEALEITVPQFYWFGYVINGLAENGNQHKEDHKKLVHDKTDRLILNEKEVRTAEDGV